MAPIKFVDAISNDRPIDIYGEGNMSRDFTYIDDLVEGIVRLSQVIPSEDNRVTQDGVTDSLSRHAPFRVVNVGGGQPVQLMHFVETVEKAVGKPAIRNMLPMQQGDVPRTFASPDLLRALTDYVPQTPVEQGIEALVAWYRDMQSGRV
jgi:UDP-glucuronate 4-epimerase